jgi:Protein of unknown function (DUF3800)
MSAATIPEPTKHYFLDEAGDSVLFGRRGQIRVGTKGCSRFFSLGLLSVADPEVLHEKLEALRTQLLADPYFEGVPSMQPEKRKTAVAFHAKDDVSEVRHQVFALLRELASQLGFQAIVRDKASVLSTIRSMNALQPNYRYRPDELYDDMVKRLMRNNLHKAERIHICFAKRGKSDRTNALATALEKAQRNFLRKTGIESSASLTIRAAQPKDVAGLQAVDYFLWSLQRLYERGEERFVKLLWPSYNLVMDLDDKSEKDYGIYYCANRPLTAEALQKRTGI